MKIVLDGVTLPLPEFVLDVSLQLEARYTALYGASGAGKTSLIEVIAGLRRPAAGRVAIGDQVVFDGARAVDVPPRHRRIGYVPQDDTLFPHLSVRQNILYGAADGKVERRRPGGRGVRGAPHTTADRVVAALEIERLLGRRTHSLSGGERKRVSMARALLSDPMLLLLDEPLSGVDTALSSRILDYLMCVREEFPIPILLVTHRMEEASALCDEVVLLDRGHVVSRQPLGK
ncbi:MAG TPA: ATP-binding cassette domain-containing protein [Thermoanaerobaculia bacterium]|nr:ATP-binding cassette domain-containing protein [Thermoanaerobaculia bacterium]